MEKKILFITHLYYPAVGGAERVFRQLAEGLAARGWEVTVLTSDALSTEHYFTNIQNNLPEKEIFRGVEVVRESIHSPIYKYLRLFDRMAKRAGRFGVFYRPLVFGPHFTSKFRHMLARRFPFVIAGPMPTSAPFYGLLYRFRFPRVKLIIFPHFHIRDRLHASFLNLLALRKADFVLAITEAEKVFFLRCGLKEKKVGRFFNAVDSLVLESSPCCGQRKIGYILYLGQEGEHKRIPLLIRAMANLWEKGVQEDLVIAGARTKFSWTIDRLIEKLPSEFRGRIHRFNNVTEEEKIRLLDGCLVMANPSSHESFGIVFLEAWARKKPVIGANIPVLKEIIEDGVDGLLFKNGNQEDLEAKILTILNEREVARRMGERGYIKVIEKYTWDRVLDRLEDYLQRIAV